MGFEQNRSTEVTGPAPCSFAELHTTDLIADRMVSEGLAVSRTPLWVRPARGNVVVLFSLLGIASALLSATEPTAGGICLALLFALWTLEAGGLPTPISLAAPKRATQDLFHQGASHPRTRVLMLVRPDSPLDQTRFGAALASASWKIIGTATAALTVLSAVAALAGTSALLSALSLIPSIALVLCTAAVLLATGRRAGGDSILSSGLPQALDAARALSGKTDPAVDLMVVGASTTGRDRRVLRSHQECNAACRTWEYATAAEVVKAVREALELT